MANSFDPDREKCQGFILKQTLEWQIFPLRWVKKQNCNSNFGACMDNMSEMLFNNDPKGAG